MRLANLNGRAALVRDEGVLDVEAASSGRFGPDPQSLFGQWDEFCAWAPTATGKVSGIDESLLGPPVPSPRQILAVGFNYLDHADEADTEVPRHPQIFTKFASSLTGPFATVHLADSEFVDWEVELVVAISRRARNVPVDDAWNHVAGLTVGQDLSDRKLQLRKPAPAQYSLGKSRPGFGPTGPYLVTTDQIPDPTDLEIGCSVAGEQLQLSRTSKMLFSVPELVSRLSAVLPLLPGDLIFTGTPGGIGGLRKPPRFLKPGEELVSTIEHVGTIRTTFATGHAT